MSDAPTETTVDLTVLLPTRNEAGNLEPLFERVRSLTGDLGISCEVVVMDGGSRDGTAEVARELGARVYQQQGAGYGAALREGFEQVRGRYVVTMDADLSHSPYLIRDLYLRRHEADVVIASRYVRYGFAQTSWMRAFLSSVLNVIFRTALELPYRDLSSGYRLYRRNALRELEAQSRDFDVLIEILVRLHNRGFRIAEVPLHYRPRGYGESNARLAHFAVSYLKTLSKMLRLRHDTMAADYEERGIQSLNPVRRGWVRAKHSWAMEQLERAGRVLDLGTGSSRLFEGLPQSVGLDVDHAKLRYRVPLGRPLVEADARHLPFPDACFDGVACLELAEHLDDDSALFPEMARVLRPGGILILGTPDRDKAIWRWLLGPYHESRLSSLGDVHYRHYDAATIAGRLEDVGLRVVDRTHVAGALLMLRCEKPS